MSMHDFLTNSLKIKNKNVDQLRCLAYNYIEMLSHNEGRLGRFGEFLSWNNRKKFYRIVEIENAFKKLLAYLYPRVKEDKLHIIPTYHDFKSLCKLSQTSVDSLGVLAEIHDKLCYFIVLDKDSYLSLKNLKEQNRYAYWRALKVIYLHEISHLLLNHSGVATFLRQQFLQGTSQNHQQQDDECEILSYVLAFWPDEQFQNLVGKVFNDWEKRNIRLDLANVYKMPLNAVVQWMIILFSDTNRYSYDLHYAWLSANDEIQKRGEEPGEILDCYDCWDVLESLDPSEKDVKKLLDPNHIEEYAAKRLFAKDTSARDALLKANDSPSKVHKICKCVAFYDESRFLYNRKHDEVVVIGLASRPDAC